MSATTVQRLRNASIRLQALTFGGTDKTTGEVHDSYETLAMHAATAEAEYRAVKAKRALQAMVEEKASAAKASHIADADEEVDRACRNYKITAAVADARWKALLTLRALYDGLKVQLQSETTADRVHGQVGT